MMNAQDVMTADPIRAQEDTPLSEALATMAEHDIRHLPVVRNEELIGIISDRDIRGLGVSLVNDEQSLQSLRQRMSRTVSEVMEGPVVSVESDAQLDDIIDVIVEEKIGAIPVVEPGSMHLVGIISVLDLLKASREAG
jgi:acetoin utilization protein AcuB